MTRYGTLIAGALAIVAGVALDVAEQRPLGVAVLALGVILLGVWVAQVAHWLWLERGGHDDT
jgi:cell shape-determining protein MreD